MNISPKHSAALILVDIQKGFDDIQYWGGNRNNPDAEENAGNLLRLWRRRGFPIFHIKHCSSDPKSLLHRSNAGNDFKDLVKPIGKETVIEKNVNSAFIGTPLKEQLALQKISKLVIVGLTTDHCVSTTTRMAANLGFETLVVSDATATFDRKGIDGENYAAELVHAIALASLNQEFATILTASQLMKDL